MKTRGRANEDLLLALKRACEDIERLYKELRDKHSDNWLGMPGILKEYRDVIKKAERN